MGNGLSLKRDSRLGIFLTIAAERTTRMYVSLALKRSLVYNLIVHSSFNYIQWYKYKDNQM